MFGGGSPDTCAEGHWEGHRYGALFRAVADGDASTLRSLFREPRYKNKGDVVDGDKGGLLVTLACKPHVVRDKEHAKEIIRVILDNGGDIDQRNSVQETPLCFAAHYNHMKIIAALVECGAKVNVTDWMGTTPVAACKKGSIMGNDNEDEQKQCLAYLEEHAAKQLQETGALAKANQGRQRGNNFYTKGKYEQAIAAYKQSLSDYQDHRTYGNLAAAELKLANRKLFGGETGYRNLFMSAATHAGKATGLQKDYPKHWYRQAKAYAGYRDMPRAKMFLEKGLEASKGADDADLKPLQEMWDELNDVGVPDTFRNRMSESFEELYAKLQMGWKDEVRCPYCNLIVLHEPLPDECPFCCCDPRIDVDQDRIDELIRF